MRTVFHANFQAPTSILRKHDYWYANIYNSLIFLTHHLEEIWMTAPSGGNHEVSAAQYQHLIKFSCQHYSNDP